MQISAIISRGITGVRVIGVLCNAADYRRITVGGAGVTQRSACRPAWPRPRPPDDGRPADRGGPLARSVGAKPAARRATNSG